MSNDKLFAALQALNEAAYVAFKESKEVGHAYPSLDRQVLKDVAHATDRLVDTFPHGASQ